MDTKELIAASEEIIHVFDRKEHNTLFAEISALRRIKEAISNKDTEPKPAKSFEECCDEVERLRDLSMTESWLFHYFKQAANLYNSETAKERDELKRKIEQMEEARLNRNDKSNGITNKNRSHEKIGQ